MFSINRNILFLVYIIILLVLFTLIFTRAFLAEYIYIPLFLAFIPVINKAIKQITNKQLGTEFFLVIATIIGLFGGEEYAITVVLIIMLIAEFFEEIIQKKSETAIESLIKLIPQEVILKTDKEEKIVNLDAIIPGMNILVKAGGNIPIDGQIVDGQAYINESTLTGESKLKQKKVNDEVYAGTFIESGSLIIKVQKIGQDTFFGKIKTLIIEAQKSKSKISGYANRAAALLIPGMLIFIFIVWLLTGNLRLIVTLLIFGSPLELTLITPLTILSGIIAGYRNGILIKGGLSLESFSQINTIIFDKTGTLTQGKFQIIEILTSNPELNKNEILKIAAIAEKRSSHPFAKAVLEEAKKENLKIPEPEHFESIVGHGIKVKYNQNTYFIGNKHFIEAKEHSNIEFDDIPCKIKERHSSFYVACDNKVCGKICISDKIRLDAKKTINELKKLGLKNICILSGDKQDITSSIAKQLGISCAYGNMFPEEKIKVIQNLQKKGQKIAMAGDGINDAPSIKQANVGIAMGAMGMEPAIEAADIVLMTNDLNKIVYLKKLSDKVFKVIKQNIFIGFLFIHTIGIILAFLQVVSPIQAALFHAIPDVAMILNSTRLIGFKIK